MKKMVLLIFGFLLASTTFGQNTIYITRGFNYNAEIIPLELEANQVELSILRLKVITIKKAQSPMNGSDQNLPQTYFMPASRSGDAFDCQVQVESALGSRGEVIEPRTNYDGNYFSVRQCSRSEKCKIFISASFRAPGRNDLKLLCREVGSLRKTVELDHLPGDDLAKLKACQNADGQLKLHTPNTGTDLCVNMKIPVTFEMLRIQLLESGLQLRLKTNRN